MTWRPIDTAPQGGDFEFLGYRDGSFYICNFGWNTDDCEPVWLEATEQRPIALTHWQPLEPPA